MSVNLIFKIAAVGILVSVLGQVLKHSGREEQASGLQELSWHYNFKIPEKSMGSIWGLRSAFSFFSE